MNRRTHLPEPFDEGPFGLDAARRAGIDGRLAWLHRPFRGVRSHEACESVADRASALAQVLPPEAAFCTSTAALLLGLPLPRDLAHDGEPLQVMTPSGRPAVRHRGCHGHRGLESRRVTIIQGLPVTSPVDTWLDLAPRVALDDLVIVGDAILARNADLIEDLQFTIGRRAGSRGIRQARAALPLIRPGVRSPMETRTRLLLVHAGLPEPEINGEVTDRCGTWIAEVDLVWREQKVIVEYDGQWHNEPGQRRLDAVRRRQLRAEGWILIEVYADDILRQPDRTVNLVREALNGIIAS